MKLYSENDSYKIYNGDMLDMLQVIKPESIDAIVCDPPYELGFMNKSWDSTGIAFKKETWQNCFEVLKPGGYLLAFGGSRTYHRIACAIEDAGFEIRDCVMYLYGTGFPKSCNIGLAIDKKNGSGDRLDGAKTPIRKNIHPTCKPTELMQYLVRLVSPKGATILDPFMGSGSTGKAVMFENRERDANYKFIGIELTDEYLPIAQARIEYARDKFKYDLEQEKVTKGKQNIFDFMESEE